MAEVETLMAAASVTIGIEPEDSRDAQQCMAAYYKELDERFENGFTRSDGGNAGKPARESRRLLPDREVMGRDRLRRAEADRRRDRRDQADVDTPRPRPRQSRAACSTC